MVVTAAVIAIVAGMAVPLMSNATDNMRLGDGARAVERELQTARLAAVSGNQPMRVRFDCPIARQYRVTELVGTPSVPAAADNAANRCALDVYPYPSNADKNSLTRPNRDGPLRTLDSTITFTTQTTIEFWPDGTAHTDTAAINPWPAIAGTGYTITLTRGSKTKSILVNGVGKIQIQ